jgi:hypothetical protein
MEKPYAQVPASCAAEEEQTPPIRSLIVSPRHAIPAAYLVYNLL